MVFIRVIVFSCFMMLAFVLVSAFVTVLAQYVGQTVLAHEGQSQKASIEKYGPEGAPDSRMYTSLC